MSETHIIGIDWNGKLEPGQSRVVRILPCPETYYHYPNEYWMLRRAARRLFERNTDLMWKDPTHLQAVLDAFALLQQVAALHPKKPYRRWEEDKMGYVFEICCPACETVFEHQGKFYAPRCPQCQRWLNERR